MTIQDQKQPFTFEEVIDYTIKEAKEALDDPYKFKKPIKNVAVIGAGPSGLPSARHLKEAGFNVRVFDRNAEPGGLWVYSEKASLKPKMPTSRTTRTIDPEAAAFDGSVRQKKLLEMTPELQHEILKKHPPSAMYRDLISNTAIEIFALPDFPFPYGSPRFSVREKQAEYLKNYAKHFDLIPLIEFNTSVDLITKNHEDNTWDLVLCKYDVYSSGIVRILRWKETFDAVVSATGIHQDPHIPDFKDLAAWSKAFPDRAIHSKQYRRPEDYLDKHVLVVGGSISAVDVVRSLDGFAKTITMSFKDPFDEPAYVYKVFRSKIPESVIIKPNIAAFSNKEGVVDGSIIFEDGTSLSDVDHVVFATGFLNRMNYLGNLAIDKKASEVAWFPPRPLYDDVPESHVVLGPQLPLNVYRYVFLMSDPTLAFVGNMPFFGMPPFFDSQARAVARVWSGRALLPSQEIMYKSTAEFDIGHSPLALFTADRFRRELYISWLNYHAERTEGEPLSKIQNFADNYEEETKKTIEIWGKASTENFEKAKKYIQEHIL